MKAKKGKKILMYIITIIVLAAAVVAVVVLTKTKKGASFEAQTPLVSVVYPEVRDINQSLTFSGYVESNLMAPAVAFVSGRVLKVNVEANQMVEKNDILVRIAPENYADIKAPEKGIVLTTLVKEGDMVTQGTPVAIIGDLDDLCVNVNVPEKYIMDIKEGQDVIITHKNTTLQKTGKVVTVEPYINPKSKTFKAKVNIDKGVSNVSWAVPGSAVDVAIITDSHKGVYVVPQSCLNQSEKLYTVADSRVEALPETTLIGDDKYVIVPKGYEKKAFIIRGQNTAFPGQNVDTEVYNGGAR